MVCPTVRVCSVYREHAVEYVVIVLLDSRTRDAAVHNARYDYVGNEYRLSAPTLPIPHVTEYGATTAVLLELYRQTKRYERALHEVHISNATLSVLSLLLVGRRQGINYGAGWYPTMWGWYTTSPTILMTERNTGMSTRFLRILIQNFDTRFLVERQM